MGKNDTRNLGFIGRSGVFERVFEAKWASKLTSKPGFMHRCGVFERFSKKVALKWFGNVGFVDRCGVFERHLQAPK